VASKNRNSKKERTKISMWISNQLLKLVDQVAENYEMTRSVYIRLVLRENLVTRGLLPHEKESPLQKAEGV